MSLNYVAFSGGLDSTYILNDLLLKGQKVVIVHINTGGPSIQLIPEAFVKRAMINKFHELYPGLIVDELSYHLPGIVSTCLFGTNITQGLTEGGDFIQTLPQQLSIRNALVHIVGTFGNESRVYTGWHKDDTENTFEAELYHYLCDISSECKIYSKDISSDQRIHIPCWELDKVVMWNSIPELIQKLVIADPVKTSFYTDSTITYVQNGSKFHEYKELGIELTERIELPYALDKIDYFIIHSSITDIFGERCRDLTFGKDRVIKLIDELRESLIFIKTPFGRSDSPSRTMALISKKYHLKE